MVYLNNAATTHPKPDSVREAVQRSLNEPPLEAGRSPGGCDALLDCRTELAALFGVKETHRVTLTPSATFALNFVIQGLFSSNRGGHVVTTELEHNSVLRPVEHLVRSGAVGATWVAPDDEGRVSAAHIAAALTKETRLVCVTHASNVTGNIQSVGEIAEVVASRRVALLIDASQSAGAVGLDHGCLPGRVFIAIAGHKGLFGPAGTGALLLPDEELAQTIVGGTGVRSESRLHPIELPLRHEAGTPNLSGFAGLAAGLRYVRCRGVEKLGRRRSVLVAMLREGLGRLDGIRLSPLAGGDGRAGIVSFTRRGWTPAQMAYALRDAFGIVVRAGLHCAPLAHRGLGTTGEGNLRVSVADFSTPEDVEQLVSAFETMGGR